MKKVFVFHEIYNVSNFTKTLNYISKNYKILPLEDFINSREKNICHLTFDDGHISMIDVIDIINHYKAYSTLFISIDKIKEKKNFWFQNLDLILNQNNINLETELNLFFNFPNNYKKFLSYSLIKEQKIIYIEKFVNFLSRKFNFRDKFVNVNLDQLELLNKSNFIEFGAHTLNHPILLLENDEIVENEISLSIKNLSNFLNLNIKSFAYPNGIKDLDYSYREKEILKKNKIDYAFTMNLDNYSSNYDNLEIPRISLTDNIYKNFIINLNPLFYNSISSINLPFIRRSENFQRQKIRNI